jgi:hypothetical protein
MERRRVGPEEEEEDSSSVSTTAWIPLMRAEVRTGRCAGSGIGGLSLSSWSMSRMSSPKSRMSSSMGAMSLSLSSLRLSFVSLFPGPPSLVLTSSIELSSTCCELSMLLEGDGSEVLFLFIGCVEYAEDDSDAGLLDDERLTAGERSNEEVCVVMMSGVCV